MSAKRKAQVSAMCGLIASLVLAIPVRAGGIDDRHPMVGSGWYARADVGPGLSDANPYRLPMDQVDELRATLARYTRAGNMQRIAELTILIDALAAETREDFHRAIRRLPVTIRDRAGNDEHGRPGIWREYTHRDGHSTRRFIPASPQGAEFGALPDTDLTRRGPFAFSSTLCEYTDDEGTYWSGDCATQLELDDASITQVEMEVQGSAAEAEGNAAIQFNDWCNTFLEPPAECPQDPATSGPTSLLTSNPSPDPSEASLFALAGLDESDALLSSSGSLSCGFMKDCTGQVLGFLAALGNHAYRMAKLASVITAANPPAGAVADAVALGAIGISALLGTTYILVQCARG